jgi:hypothetical protein
MSSGSLTDLDPPTARERRWPFYLAWTVGGLAVGAVLVSHIPASFVRVAPPVAAPAATAEPIRSAEPAPPRPVNPPPPLRVAPLPAAPARP